MPHCDLGLSPPSQSLGSQSLGRPPQPAAVWRQVNDHQWCRADGAMVIERRLNAVAPRRPWLAYTPDGLPLRAALAARYRAAGTHHQGPVKCFASARTAKAALDLNVVDLAARDLADTLRSARSTAAKS